MSGNLARRATLVCLIVLGLSLGACANKDQATSPATVAAAPEPAPESICRVLDGFQPTSTEGPAFGFDDEDKVQLEVTRNRSLTDDHEMEPVLKKGTVLGVVVRETCGAPGPISARYIESSTLATPFPTNSGVRSHQWTLPNDMRVSEVKELADRDECIELVSDLHVAHVAQAGVMNDPLIDQQGHLKALHAMDAYDILISTMSVKPIVVAVIDTGVDTTHDDLRNVLWQNPREVADNAIDDDRNGYVDDINGYNFALGRPNPHYVSSVKSYQHGTHVSGLAAAQGENALGGAGVMPFETKVMALNVFGRGSGGAASTDIANAIRYAADNGADVINLSLGGEGRSAEYLRALRYAVSKGVVVFAAAGNDGRELGKTTQMAPAIYAKDLDGLVSVGSVDATSGTLSKFSNFSAVSVEIAAPGSEDSSARLGLLSTWPGNKYARIQGTSMAAPVASGAAAMAIAMLRARGYVPTAAVIEKVLTASAVQKSHLMSKIRQGGSLDLKSLTDYIKKHFPDAPAETPVNPGDVADEHKGDEPSKGATGGGAHCL